MGRAELIQCCGEKTESKSTLRGSGSPLSVMFDGVRGSARWSSRAIPERYTRDKGKGHHPQQQQQQPSKAEPFFTSLCKTDYGASTEIWNRSGDAFHHGAGAAPTNAGKRLFGRKMCASFNENQQHRQRQ